MDTCGDARWAQRNAPEILAKRGYSPATVQLARRFYNGQLTPGEVLPTVLKFIDAYSYHSSPLYHPTLLALAMRFGLGPPMIMRPEATIFGSSQLLQGWTVMHRLSEIKVPTLVLAGRHDFLFPPEHQAILADRLPNAQLELFERSGHNPQIEQTAEVIEVVQRFMMAKHPMVIEEERT
jgi:proline iminopeptidase